MLRKHWLLVVGLVCLAVALPATPATAQAPLALDATFATQNGILSFNYPSSWTIESYTDDPGLGWVTVALSASEGPGYEALVQIAPVADVQTQLPDAYGVASIDTPLLLAQIPAYGQYSGDFDPTAPDESELAIFEQSGDKTIYATTYATNNNGTSVLYGNIVRVASQVHWISISDRYIGTDDRVVFDWHRDTAIAILNSVDVNPYAYTLLGGHNTNFIADVSAFDDPELGLSVLHPVDWNVVSNQDGALLSVTSPESSTGVVYHAQLTRFDMLNDDGNGYYSGDAAIAVRAIGERVVAEAETPYLYVSDVVESTFDGSKVFTEMFFVGASVIESRGILDVGNGWRVGVRATRNDGDLTAFLADHATFYAMLDTFHYGIGSAYAWVTAPIDLNTAPVVDWIGAIATNSTSRLDVGSGPSDTLIVVEANFAHLYSLRHQSVLLSFPVQDGISTGFYDAITGNWAMVGFQSPLYPILQIIDGATGEQIHSFDPGPGFFLPLRPGTVALIEDSINSADLAAMIVFDMQTGEIVISVRLPIERSIQNAFLYNDDVLTCAGDLGQDKATLAQYDIETGALIDSFTLTGLYDCEHLAYHPATDTLAYVGEGDNSTTSDLFMVDLSERRIAWQVPLAATATAAPAFNPDGSIVAIGQADRVELYHAATGELLRELRPHRNNPLPADAGGYAYRPLFSTDGYFLFVAGRGLSTIIFGLPPDGLG